MGLFVGQRFAGLVGKRTFTRGDDLMDPMEDRGNQARDKYTRIQSHGQNNICITRSITCTREENHQDNKTLK